MQKLIFVNTKLHIMESYSRVLKNWIELLCLRWIQNDYGDFSYFLLIAEIFIVLLYGGNQKLLSIDFRIKLTII